MSKVTFNSLTCFFFFLFTAVFCDFGLPFFPLGSPWTDDITLSNDTHPNSSQILQWLTSQGSWGFGGNFRVDRTINVLKANCSTPRIPFSRKPGYYTSACDDIPFFPVPNNGALEGNESWKSPCEGDCHLIVFDEDSGLLWESWDTDITLDSHKTVIALNATCAVVWNTSHLYPSSGRGEGCTSADAAGFPIASLLFTADEIMNGSINHAIRFILPNNRMRNGYYIHPASHYGGPSSTHPYSVIYGSRFRLKSSFNMNGYSNEAKVVLTALQKYGMYLSDGGNIALTAQSDWHNSEYTWDEVNLGVNDLYGVLPNDFEIMNGWGNNPTKGYYNTRPDCVKNDIPVNIYGSCDESENIIYGSKNYSSYYVGNSPVIILSQHGGYMEPEDIPLRKIGCWNGTECVWSELQGCNSTYSRDSSKCDIKVLRDAYTQEFAKCLRNNSILTVNNKQLIPHLVINHLHRNRLDANREIGEAAQGNSVAITTWNEIHNIFMESAKESVKNQCNFGVVIDVHGQSANKYNQLGYRLTSSEIEMSDIEIDLLTDETSMKNLAINNRHGHTLSELIRGINAMGTILNETYDHIMVPSRRQPNIPNDYYYRGGFGTREHGSEDNSDVVDSFQIEVNYDNRWISHLRQQFCEDFSSALVTFMEYWYNISQCETGDSNGATIEPSEMPTNNPSKTVNTTNDPSEIPSLNPTSTMNPSNDPSVMPSLNPTSTMNPSTEPTLNPSGFPVSNPVSEMFSTTKISKSSSNNGGLTDFGSYGLVEYAIIGSIGLVLIVIIATVFVCYCKKQDGRNNTNKDKLETSHRYSFDNPYTVGMSTFNTYNQTQKQTNIVQIED